VTARVDLAAAANPGCAGRSRSAVDGEASSRRRGPTLDTSIVGHLKLRVRLDPDPIRPSALTKRKVSARPDALWRLWLRTRDPRALLAWGRSLDRKRV
jgi:hypothetical protein